MAIEEEVVEATTSTTDKSTPAPDPVETSSRSDPAQESGDKRRSKLNEMLRGEFDKQKRDPSAARQAAAAQRAREEGTGKFAPTEPKATEPIQAKVEQPAKGATPEAKPVPEKEAKSEPVKAPQAPAAAPAALSKETKAIWDTLPEVVRNDIIKREGDTAKGVEQLQQRYRPIDEALQPYRPLLQQAGKSEGDAIKMLFAWHMGLASQNPQVKANTFRALAQSHGFDLSTLAPQSSGQQPQQQQPTTDQNDPRAAIQQIVQQALQGYMAPMDQRLNAWEQRLQQEQQSKVQSEIGEFSKDKPHFERVRTAMGQMMQAGYATSLEDAYNKAVWADPEIRAELQAAAKAEADAQAKAAKDAADAKAAQAEAERKLKEREAADKARKANVSPRAGTPSGSMTPVQKTGKSVKQSVAEAIKEHRRASI